MVSALLRAVLPAKVTAGPSDLMRAPSPHDMPYGSICGLQTWEVAGWGVCYNTADMPGICHYVKSLCRYGGWQGGLLDRGCGGCRSYLAVKLHCFSHQLLHIYIYVQSFENNINDRPYHTFCVYGMRQYLNQISYQDCLSFGSSALKIPLPVACYTLPFVEAPAW